MELNGVSRASRPSQPAAVGRRAEDVLLALSSRATGAGPALQRRPVEPVFRRPSLEAPAARRSPEPTLGPATSGGEQQAAHEAAQAPAVPPFEWLDLEIIPLGQKPDPRGYAVYAQRSRPAPAPVILIDAA